MRCDRVDYDYDHVAGFARSFGTYSVGGCDAGAFTLVGESSSTSTLLSPVFFAFFDSTFLGVDFLDFLLPPEDAELGPFEAVALTETTHAGMKASARHNDRTVVRFMTGRGRVWWRRYSYLQAWRPVLLAAAGAGPLVETGRVHGASAMLRANQCSVAGWSGTADALASASALA